MPDMEPTTNAMMKDWPLWKKLTAGAVAVAAGAGILYWLWKPKDASAATLPGTTPPPVEEDSAAVYSRAPAMSLKLAQLPVLRPGTAGTAGSTMWVVGDELGQLVGGYLVAGGMQTGNATTEDIGLLNSTTLISDMAAQVANQGTSGLPTADVYFVALGPKQDKLPVGALKESIAILRKKLPTQRIVWVLSKSTPWEIAKALNESQEEWVRTSTDDATGAMDAWKAATAQSTAELNAAFPPPPST